jgi:electron transfer flavoprotein beta subunit
VALQLKDAAGAEVVAVCGGPERAEEALRQAWAMGADRGIHLTDKLFSGADGLVAARLLAAAVRKLGEVDLVFVGRLTIDTNSALLGPMIARHLGTTLLSEVFKVDEIDQGARTITVERLLEGGLQVVRAKLPALVAVTKDLNQPRYPSLLGIRKASKAPVTVWSAADVGAAVAPLTRASERQVPPARPAGQVFQGSSPELVERIVEKLAEGKFI